MLPWLRDSVSFTSQPANRSSTSLCDSLHSLHVLFCFQFHSQLEIQLASGRAMLLLSTIFIEVESARLSSAETLPRWIQFTCSKTWLTNVSRSSPDVRHRKPTSNSMINYLYSFVLDEMNSIVEIENVIVRFVKTRTEKRRVSTWKLDVCVRVCMRVRVYVWSQFKAESNRPGISFPAARLLVI